MATKSSEGRLTYQPYAFALAFVSLVAKIAYSLSRNQPVLDKMLWLCAGAFIVTSLLYVIELFAQRPAKRRTISTEISTGNVRDSQVIGISAGAADEVHAELKTRNVSGSSLTGFKERD